jgi:hypothetical protein
MLLELGFPHGKIQMVIITFLPLLWAVSEGGAGGLWPDSRCRAHAPET